MRCWCSSCIMYQVYSEYYEACVPDTRLRRLIKPSFETFIIFSTRLAATDTLSIPALPWNVLALHNKYQSPSSKDEVFCPVMCFRRLIRNLHKRPDSIDSSRCGGKALGRGRCLVCTGWRMTPEPEQEWRRQWWASWFRKLALRRTCDFEKVVLLD